MVTYAKDAAASTAPAEDARRADQGSASHPYRRRVGLLAAALLLLAGYVAVAAAIPLWAWLAGGLVGLAGVGRFLKRSSRRSGPIPPRSIVQEVHVHGLRMAVGYSGVEAFRTSVYAAPILSDVAGFIIVNSPDRPGQDVLQQALARIVAEASCLGQAAARFLRFLDGQCRVEYALVGLWHRPQKTLYFFAPGFEAPVIVRQDSLQRLEGTVTKETDRGAQTMSFGTHHLSRGERWLFHTGPLIETKGLWKRPFDYGRLLESACEVHTMANEHAVDVLLERCLEAHKNSLPTGAMLVSVVCE